MTQDKRRYLFILGLTQRTGTNYLYKLLELHPDCGGIMQRDIGESYMVMKSHHLYDYVQDVTGLWSEDWNYDRQLKNEFAHHIGDGILQFLDTLTNKPVVMTKTPSVNNLDKFFEFFPHAQLIIMVRDGRSVTESTVKGFGASFADAARDWARAADKLQAFQERYPEREDKQFKVVRYEDLFSDPRGELRSILEFIKVNPAEYDFDKACNAPVFGSSYMKQQDKVTWKPKERPKDFNPLARFAKWDRKEHMRFNWIAGAQLEALGYSTQRFDTGDFSYRMYNALTDATETAVGYYAGLKRRLAF